MKKVWWYNKTSIQYKGYYNVVDRFEIGVEYIVWYNRNIRDLRDLNKIRCLVNKEEQS